MQRFAHVLCALIIVLLASVTPAGAQMKELEVFNDWRGVDCTFEPDKPFFLIRDIYDLETFWPQAHTDEATPGIDFEKYMLLVWCPGSSLFDFRPVRVERFVYKEGAYFVLMEFERKDTGGYWRRPFMATLLPRVKTGDIFILRKESKNPQQLDWKPMYAIWDMTGERKRPFEVVQLDKAPEAVKFVDHGKGKGAEQTQQQQVASVDDAPAAVTTPAAPVGETAAASTVPVSQPVQPNQPVQVTPPVQPTQPVSPVSTQSQPAASETKPPQATSTLQEDPLFGTEFDITF